MPKAKKSSVLTRLIEVYQELQELGLELDVTTAATKLKANSTPKKFGVAVRRKMSEGTKAYWRKVARIVRRDSCSVKEARKRYLAEKK